MPKYSFKCENCDLLLRAYASRNIKQLECSNCASQMKRQLPILTGNPDVTEIINKYTGKTVKQDQGKMIKERRDRHYWGVEVPRLVASGVYGMDTMLENGWVWFDDNKQMRVNTKPPHER